MAKLKEYNGHYCESEYEYAFIGFLEVEGWIYTSGNIIKRVTKRDVLIADDFKQFIADTNAELTEDEVTQIFDNVRLVGSESDFATLHKVYGWMVDGIQFTPQNSLAKMVALIDFENPDKNIYRVVNQFTVEYTNNGQKENRRPDVLEEIKNQTKIQGIVFANKICFTKSMVATYFEVEIRTLERYVSEFQDEICSNGYEILKGKRLKSFLESVENQDVPDINVGNISNRTPQLSIFDFRSFLNIAMLLVESPIARSLRQVMLDIVIDYINQKSGGRTKYINQRDSDFIKA